MKIFSFLIILFNLFTIINTIPANTFDENIKDGYEKYIYVLDEETVYGDLALVIGNAKSKTYLSCFLFSHNQNSHLYLRIKLDNKITTYVPDSLVVEGYGLEVKNESTLKFYIYDGENEILINEYNIDELKTNLLENYKEGNATAKFPSNKKEVSLLLKLEIALVIFSLIFIGLIVLLVILYRKKIGKFNRERLNSNDTYIDATFEYTNDSKVESDEDSFNEYMNNHQNIKESNNVNESKEQIIERLFNEYRTGDITEEELDERLKNLEDNHD